MASFYTGVRCLPGPLLHRILQEALGWYAECRAGCVIVPNDKDDQNHDKVLAIASLADEPAWPHLVARNDLPFVSADWGTVRVHHLVQVAKLDAVNHIVDHDQAIRWFSDRLYFKLADYPHWMGSVHLVAPNPVCRYIAHRRGQGPQGGQTSHIRLVGRADAPLSGLRLLITQQSQAGMLAACSRDVIQPDIAVAQPVPIWSIGHILTCPERGVLDWLPSSPYVDSLPISTSFVVEQRRVAVPVPPGAPSETYDVSRLSAPRILQVGDPVAHDSAAAYLDQCESARRRRQLAEERGEKWFHNNQEEARDFVRGLVSAAKRRVWIVDPYFATVELYRFALAVATDGVKTIILTGADRLREDQRLVPGTTVVPGEILLNEITRLPSGDSVDVHVMTGSKPIVHDRFLVIDDDVWFSGNSLHSLGERASMMVKLIDPTPIITALESVMKHPDRVVTLRRWVERQRQVQQSGQAGQGQPANAVGNSAAGTYSSESPQATSSSPDRSVHQDTDI